MAAEGLATIKEQEGGMVAVSSSNFNVFFTRMVNRLNTGPTATKPEQTKPVLAEIPEKRVGLGRIFDGKILKRVGIRI